MNEEKNNVNQEDILDASSIFNQTLNGTTNGEQVSNANNLEGVNPGTITNQAQDPSVMVPNMNVEMSNTNQQPVSNTAQDPSVMVPNMNMGMNNINPQPVNNPVQDPSVMVPNMNVEMSNTNQQPLNNPVQDPSVMVPNMNVGMNNINQQPVNNPVQDPSVMVPNMNVGMNNVNQQPLNNPVQDPNTMMPNMNTGINNVNPGSVNNQVSNQNMSNGTNISTQMMNMQPILEPINQVESIDMSEPVQKPKKKKSKLPIIIIILVLVIAIIGGGLFYLKSINVYEKFIDNSFNSIYEGLTYDSSTSTMTLNANVSVENLDSNTQSMLDIINKLTVSTTSQIDTKNNIANYDLNTKYDGKDLINLNIYSKDNTYVYLNNIYDKYIQVPMEEQTTLTIDDKKTLLLSIKNALNNSLNNKYITRKMDGTKWINTLVLDSDNSNEICKTFFKTLSEDNNFISVLSKVDNESANNFKEIDKYLNDENFSVLEQGEQVTINVYTSMLTNEFMSADIIYDLDGVQNKVIIEKNDNVYNITFKEDDDAEIKFIVTINEKDNNKDISLECNYEGVSIKVNMTSSVDYNVNIEPKDITNSISYEQLTEEDITTIQNNLMQNEGINEIMTIINSNINYLLDNIEDKVNESYYNDPYYDDTFYNNL